jgi:hypothetical protein
MLSVTYGALTLYTAADTSMEYVGGLGVPGAQQVNPAGIAQASHERYDARGNRTTSPAFTVRRVFATVEAAELFCHDLNDSMPASGDLVFTYSGGQVRRYAGACYTQVAPQQSAANGRVLSISYAFAAGAVTTS